MTSAQKPLFSPSDLQTWLEIGTEAALAAGAEIFSLWGKVQEVEEKGRAGDLVTEADRQAEAMILGIIKRHCPDHGILAEESGQWGSGDNPFCWAIDPLDGTTNFAHGYPVSCVSIGLLVQGIPTVGVIYNPFRQELFRAASSLGATLNRQPIQVSTTTSLAKSLLVSGFAYDRVKTLDNNYPEFCHLTHLTQGVRRSGSAAIDLTDVACGRLDGYWERGINPWDIAAGIVIVQEAGGVISSYDGSPLDLKTGRILATNGKIHHELSQALADSPQWFQDYAVSRVQKD
ncbi:inositol monophosphatase [Synechocystis salina LEGE 06099]|uniref:inositol monophosphatase family protein n=1 Tax=Synechocystis salina TaxID=945780 RepID=UPI0018823EF7|nr:inositol monophosphatase family protein [Synechocystis salina]MBE9203668.1 inositol monophosphatase [Synechocystis salina LEGE 06099]